MYKHRWLIWIWIAIVLFSCIGVDSYEQYKESIVPKDIYYYVDEDLKESFADITDNESILLKYNLLQSEELSNANIILTSDFTKINSKAEYDILATSPLIMAMKNSKDLNNFRTANTKYGWLSTVSININNDKTELIKCDFKKVFYVVVSGGDWSDLGGADEEIKIYCPDLRTQEGQTFKEFLFKQFEFEEIQIEQFFSSSNVIQTDVISRIEELENNIPSNELYIDLEKDFLEYVYNFEKSNDNLNLSFIYPEKIISQAIYLQYNNADEALKEELAKSYFDFSELEDHYGLDEYFYENKFYRDITKWEYCYSEKFEQYNFQKGINALGNKIYIKIN